MARYAGEPADGGAISKAEADRRRAVAMAISAEVEVDRALGVAVDRREVEADLSEFTGLLNTGLGNACAKIAARAAVVQDAPTIQQLAETEINRAYTAAIATLADAWRVGDKGET